MDIESVLDAIASLRDEALRKMGAAEDAADSYWRAEDQERRQVARADINRYGEQASAFGRALRAAQDVIDRGNG